MPGTYSLAFWNLENLFAPEGYAQREPWIAERMRSELAGWTEALFERKLEQLASLIVRLNGGNGPALLDVCEVEKRFALERLASRLVAPLPSRDYALVHADAERDQRGIDTAFLYDRRRLSADPALVFSHW